MSVFGRLRATIDRLWAAFPRTFTTGAMALLGFFGLFVGIVVASLIVGILFANGIDVRDRTFLSLVVSLVSIQGVGLSVIGLVYLAGTGRGVSYLRARLPSLRDVGWVVGGTIAIFALLVVVATAIGVITQATGVETAQNSAVTAAQENPSVLLLMIPAAFLVIGPAEELMFRGIIQNRLREVFGAVGAIGVASVIFGLGHVTALTGGQGGIAAIALPLAALSLLSVVFGVAYERTDNLVVPVLIHGAYDAILFGLLYLALTSDSLETATNNSSALLAALV